MFEKVNSGVKAGLLASALIVLPAVSFAQTPTAPPPQSAQPAAGEVKKISVDQAVQMALEQNLSLQVQRVTPQVRQMDVAVAKSAYAPLLKSTFSNGSTDTPSGNVFTGAGLKQTTDSRSWSVGATQNLRTGGYYDFSWGGSRTQDNALGNYINPRLGSSLNLTLFQPLARNFRIDANREQLLISKKNQEMSDIDFRQTVLATVRNVKNAYWNLSYFISSLAVQQQSLDLARESLRNNEARVKIGTMAPIDIIQGQAEVASREEAVITAQAAVDRAEDALRTLIMDPRTPGFWNMKFDLSDAPDFRAASIDVDAAVKNAIAQRTDLAQERKSLEINDVAVRYLKNQIMPDVNVTAKYGMTAQGGTLLRYDYTDVLNPVYLGVGNQIGYGSMFRSLFKNDYPQWSFALSFGYPLGTSNAEANLAKARLQYGQAETQLRANELSVATQVRDAARQVLANQKRVESTRASRELQEKKLEAEQKKFAAGMQTTFFVLQAQRDLAQAKNAELQAILDYTRSLVDYDTVQQAPVSGSNGSGIVITTGGGSSGGSGSGE